MELSPRQCAGQDGPIALTVAASDALPADAMYEILLRVPAKALCRMRAVSRQWRRLLSDPRFAAAHAARCQEPLFIAADFDPVGGGFVDIIDLSGQIVKRVHLNKSERVLIMPHDLVFFFDFGSWLARVVNPATGAVYLLPDDLSEEHAARGLHQSDYYDEDQFLVGLIASTSEYKVLRVLSPSRDGVPDLCEICTLSTRSDGNARWRGKHPPPGCFVMEDWNSVVIDGVAYLIRLNVHGDQVAKQDWIMSFDLEEEEWLPNIEGPQISFCDNRAEMSSPPTRMQLTLSNLNGSLAVVHGPPYYINIWILKDLEKGLWVKQYSLKVERHHDIFDVNPLLVLDDGRIVIHKEGAELLQSYDPRTNTSTNLVEMNHYYCSAINIYTGNLLSLDQLEPLM